MNKIERRLRRKRGIRKKIYGTKDRPRVTVFKSNKHIYAQAIDDDRGHTLAYVFDKMIDVKKDKEGAFKVGERLAVLLKEKKIEAAVFDRNGYPYHGIVKSVAEGLRKGGIML